MKLEVLKQFNDAVANKLRNVGDVFEADAARAKVLLAHPLQLVKEAKNAAKVETADAAEDVKEAFETAEKKPVVKKKPAAKKTAKK